MSEIKDFYGRTVAYAQVIYGPKQPTVEELKEQIDQLRSELDRHQELLKELVVDPKSTSPEFLPHFEKAHKNPVYWMEIATLLREELEAERGKSISRECLTEFVKAYESLKSATDCAIQDSDVSNAFARAVEAVNQELRRTE